MSSGFLCCVYTTNPVQYTPPGTTSCSYDISESLNAACLVASLRPKQLIVSAAVPMPMIYPDSCGYSHPEPSTHHNFCSKDVIPDWQCKSQAPALWTTSFSDEQQQAAKGCKSHSRNVTGAACTLSASAWAEQISIKEPTQSTPSPHHPDPLHTCPSDPAWSAAGSPALSA